MPLLGQAAVAMWWNVRPEQRVEFGDWHSHEHLPERLGIPGFERGSRWTSTEHDGDFFILYELATYETLTSKGYLDRLNTPTPWSTKMMPHHLNMVRSQCRIAASFGCGVAAAMATIRLSPADGKNSSLKEAIVSQLEALATKPGLTGAHLLVTDTPTTSAPTAEQKIRGGDGVADWIVLLTGYDADSITSTLRDPLSPHVLQRAGAREKMTVSHFVLNYSMTPADVAAS